VTELTPYEKATTGSQHPADLEGRILQLVDVMDDL
jgi:hypothetical protein